MRHVTECHDCNIPEQHEHYKDRMNQLGYKRCPECGKFYMDDTKLRSHYYDSHSELWPNVIKLIKHVSYIVIINDASKALITKQIVSLGLIL